MKWRSLEESAPTQGTRPLSAVLAERKQLIERYVPAQTQAVHSRVVSSLRESGIADRVIAVGARAPEFALENHLGGVTRSADLLSRGPLVLCVFRGRWCPFCVAQLEAMNAIVPQLAGHHASLVAISPQTVRQSSLMADQHKLQFALLSDKGNQVARQFGLVYQVPDYQKEIYRSAFVNLPFINGDESWELPMPATFIIDSDATVLYRFVSPDFTERAEPSAILENLP